MPQVLESLCLTHCWMNPLSGVIYNWTPHYKSQKVGKFLNKISSKVCKWSSLNVPGTGTPVSHSLMEESCFSFPAPLSGVIDNWTPQYESLKDRQILGQNQLNRLQMVQFECPRYWNPCVSLTVGGIPFLISSPSLWGNI